MANGFRILRATAIGDAFGAGLEYVPPEATRDFVLGWGFLQNPRYPDILPGMFTDDTMLSVAGARAILADAAEGREPGADAYYEAMVRLDRDHPSGGYSKPTRAALDAARTGAELRAAFEASDRSESNGAAMRAAIYGAMPDVAAAMRAAEACGGATHRGEGVRAARAVAAASHYLLRGLGPREGLDAFVAHHAGDPWTTPYEGRVAPQLGSMAHLTVRAALTALRSARTLTDVLQGCIRIGGDVDTVAAIGMGLAGSCAWLSDDLPAGLWRGEGMASVSGLGWRDLENLDRSMVLLACN